VKYPNNFNYLNKELTKSFNIKVLEIQVKDRSNKDRKRFKVDIQLMNEINWTMQQT